MKTRGGVTVSKKLVCKRCGGCCGPIPFPPKLFNRFKGLVQRPYTLRPFLDNIDIIPWTEDGNCVFLKPDNNCIIYKDRPKVCRIYGVNKKLPCGGNER